MEGSMVDSDVKPVEIFVRNRTEAPHVVQHHLGSSYSRLHESPETTDLINILESIGSEYDARHVAGISMLDGHHSNTTAAGMPWEDSQLRQVLQKRMGLRRVEDGGNMHSSLWPVIHGSEKRRRTAKSIQKDGDSSGLDAQLRMLAEDRIRQYSSQLSSSDDDLTRCSLEQDDIVSFLPGRGADEWVRTVNRRRSAGNALSAAAGGPFRRPVQAVRKLVSDRMFLLDDHCLPCRVGSSAATRPLSSKDHLVDAACKRLPPSSSSSGTANGSGGSAGSNVAFPDAIGGSAPVSGSESMPAAEDNRAGVVKEIVACHAEALADAALEMVFKFVQGMKRASSMAGEGLQGDPLDKDDDASDSGDLSEEDGEGGAGRGEVKARGDSGSKKINVKVKATADRSSGDADGGRVYSWADVLAAVRGQRDQAVKVHQSLPALPLTEEVRRRTELRLAALFGSTGSTGDADSSCAITAVVNRRGREVPRVLRLEPRQEALDDIGASTVEGGDKKRKRRDKPGKLVPAAMAPHVWDK